MVATLSVLLFAAMPFVASAGIFDGLSYGATYYTSNANTCPAYDYPYYSCPSGIGGIFGAPTGYGGGYGSYGSGYGYAPSHQPPYYSPYQYQQPQHPYYPPQQAYYYPPQQYAYYYPSQQYYYQPSYSYGYDYYDQLVYAPSIGSPVIYYGY